MPSSVLKSPSLRHTWLARYGVAVVAVVVVLGVRLALAHVLHLRSPFLLLFAAVVVSATYGGLGPGVLATALATLGSRLFIGETGTDPSDLALFTLEGLFLSLVGALFHRARRRLEVADDAARRLEQKILEISEDERRRIGHDLHDGLGQHLTGIALLTKALKQRLTARGLPEAEQAAKVAELVNESIGWTRDLARGLSPMTLDSGGLPPALEELADNASRILGIECTCDFDAVGEGVGATSAEGGRGATAIDGERSLHLYRIAQEAVNNSVRHGKAQHVRIGLREGPGTVRLTISDDGKGLSQKTLQSPGIGLQIMEYRARMIGADLSVRRTSESGGTTISCILAVMPSDEPPRAVPPAARGPAAGLGARRVVIRPASDQAERQPQER